MRKPLKIFLFLILLALKMNGQTIYFNNLYDYGGNSDFIHGVLPLDNGYLTIGPLVNDTVGTWDIGLLKIDIEGNTSWKKTYHWPNTNMYVGRKSLIPTNDSNFVFCGYKWDAFAAHAYLMKIDNNGDSLWMRTYGTDSAFSFNNVKQTADGGFILVGITDSLTYFGDWLIMKTDSLGYTQWIKVIVPGMDYDDARVVEITNDGGYIIGGIKYIGNQDYGYIVKMNSAGNSQWQLTIGGTYGGQINDIKQMSDSSYIVCGAFHDYYNGIIMKSYGQGYIAKISANGNIVWQKKYGMNGYLSNLSCIQEVTNGYVFAGNSGNITDTVAAGFIFKTDFAGNSKWERYYNRTGNDNQNMLEDIKSTADGGFIAGGWFYPDHQFMWVMKLDSLGCDTTGCQFVGITEEEYSGSYLTIYPNPVYGSMTIEWFLESNLPPATLKIINLMGQTVLNQTMLPANNVLRETVNLDELSQGIYLLSITTGEKTVTRKFIKQ